MAHGQPTRCLPTMEMVADALLRAGFSCRGSIQNRERAYRGVRLYSGQNTLQRDLIYLLPHPSDFPTDAYAYVCAEDLPGQADHLYCPGSAAALLDALLEYFAFCQEAQFRMDQLLPRGGSLQELCQLGEALLENPVCIHDDWFILSAMSPGAEAVMAPEYVASFAKGFVPRAIVEAFQHDSDYLETYAHREARI